MSQPENATTPVFFEGGSSSGTAVLSAPERRTQPRRPAAPRTLRRAYGFDEVAIVPGDVTINPDQTDISFSIGPYTFRLPVLASAMDAVVDVNFAIALGRLGGLAVLNLEGIQTRYERPEEVLELIRNASDAEATALLQRLYTEAPIRPDLIAERVAAIKAAGVVCAVAVTPANTKRLAPIAVNAGADILVVQSPVTTARHISKSQRGLIFSELIQSLGVPVIVGNTVSYSATMALLEEGVDGVLVGVGPGAACTTEWTSKSVP